MTTDELMALVSCSGLLCGFLLVKSGAFHTPGRGRTMLFFITLVGLIGFAALHTDNIIILRHTMVSPLAQIAGGLLIGFGLTLAVRGPNTSGNQTRSLGKIGAVIALGAFLFGARYGIKAFYSGGKVYASMPPLLFSDFGLGRSNLYELMGLPFASAAIVMMVVLLVWLVNFPQKH